MLKYSLSNGVAWEFRDVSTKTWRDAQVPGCVHRDLRRHELIPDPFWGRNEFDVQWVSDRVWEYRAEFPVSVDLLNCEHIDLIADGLDTLATVTLNGEVVARSENMFIGVRTAVRRHLRPGSNELLVRFESATAFLRTQRLSHRPREINDPVGGCTKMRKEQCQFGWDWAPRLVTAGIWRDLRLEGWSGNRFRDVRLTQHHSPRGRVTLEVQPELVRAMETDVRIEGVVRFNGDDVARFRNGRAVIPEPQLWWPQGQGGQPLYEVRLELWRGGECVDVWTRRIGLRTIELQRKRDRWGESFQFVVNGRPVFAKGASWIPAHSFVAGLARADYEPLIRSAAAANMNMLRVWGGGVYEHDCFYDLCDELGLLVWHDFMFACTLYPGDAAFLKSVEAEAEYQVRRLRDRACLALWCGNNELELLNSAELQSGAKKKAYDAVFRRILPNAVTAFDGVTPYWRSSPSQSDKPGLRNPQRSGNTHFWDVWHLLKPVKNYENEVYRFVSEFGMQSFPSLPVARTFCPEDQLNVFSPVMECHQKNPSGNKIILDYLSRRYRFPKDYAALASLSQLNQAYCMQVGVEHYRRNRPQCMGTLYWQLNDCWPVASWSSLEFGGHWKALHHVARRFYAPVIVTAHVNGAETVGIGNRLQSTVTGADLFTVSDAPEPIVAQLRWELFRVEGPRVATGGKQVVIQPRQSMRQLTVDCSRFIAKFGREQLYLRIALEREGECISEETVFLAPPRVLDLPRAETKIRAVAVSPHVWQLTFVSSGFQHRFAFDLGAVAMRHCSDNWFELYPDRPKVVTIEVAERLRKADLLHALSHRSLVDTYV